MNKSQTTLAYALISSVLVVTAVTALLTTQEAIPGTGSIKGVGIGVYWDIQCSNKTSSLDFGQLEPGSSKNYSLFLRNEGNTPLTLSMTSDNWSPANTANHIILTWDLEGQQISPQEVRQFIITISVSENVTGIGSFSVDIVISGTG